MTQPERLALAVSEALTAAGQASRAGDRTGVAWHSGVAFGLSFREDHSPVPRRLMLEHLQRAGDGGGVAVESQADAVALAGDRAGDALAVFVERCGLLTGYRDGRSMLVAGAGLEPATSGL